MEIKFRVSCPCECREIVEATDRGFNATTITIEPCSTIKLIDPAVVSSEVSKSRIIQLLNKMSMKCEICGSDGTWCSEAVMKVGA